MSIETKIEENAQRPLRGKNEQMEIEQHPLSEQIAADKYLASKTAVTSTKTRGVFLNKFKAGSAV